MQRIPVLLGGFIILIALVLFLNKDSTEKLGTSVTESVGHEVSTEELDRPTAPTQAAITRTEVLTDEIDSQAKESSWVQVQVVDDATGEAVPYAVVFVIDLSDISDLTPEQLAILETLSLDYQAMAEHFGQRYPTDAEGLVSIPTAEISEEFGLHLMAGKDDSFGVQRELGKDGRIQIRLSPNQSVRVHLVNANGQDAIHEKVSLAYQSLFSGRPSPFLTVTTDAYGMALLRLSGLNPEASSDTTHWIYPHTILREDFGFQIDLTQLPKEVVELALPPTGDLILSVTDSRGKPFTDLIHATLTFEQAPDYAFSLGQVKPNEDGTWLFHNVEIDQGFTFEIKTKGFAFTAKTQSIIPGSATGPVRIQLRLQPVRPVLLGQVVDAEGNPASGQEVKATLTHHNGTGRSAGINDLQLDVEGRFRYVVSPSREEWKKRYFMLELSNAAPNQKQQIRVDLSSPLDLGEHDLGILKLEEIPTIAAGTVHGPNGLPVASAMLQLEREYIKDGRPTGMWTPIFQASCNTHEDGSFHLQGNVEQEPFRLKISAGGFRTHFQSFALGDPNLAIVLPEAQTLRIQVLTDDGIDANQIQFEFKHLLQNDPSERPWPQSFQAIQVKDQFVEIRNLPTGTGTFSVLNASTNEVLAKIENIFIQGVEAPQSLMVDLRGQLIQFRVTVDPSSIEKDAGFYLQAPLIGIGRRGFGAEGVSVTSKEHGITLHASSMGKRTLTLTNVSSDQHLVFEQGYAVRIHLDSPIALPEGMHFTIDLLEDGDDWRTDRYVSHARSSFGDKSMALTADHDVIVTLGESGTFRVLLLLSSSQSGFGNTFISRRNPERMPRIDVENKPDLQNFTIRPNQDDLEAAIDHLVNRK